MLYNRFGLPKSEALSTVRLPVAELEAAAGWLDINSNNSVQESKP
jgi:hypothetical protein